MAKNVLIKPIITEKSEELSAEQSKYTFKVERKANKIQITRAIEEMYEVNVAKVNTMIVPGKFKMRTTRTGVSQGIKPPYKKAIVTLYEGDEIDFFGDI